MLLLLTSLSFSLCAAEPLKLLFAGSSSTYWNDFPREERPKNFPLLTQPRGKLRTLPEHKRATYRADKITAAAA